MDYPNRKCAHSLSENSSDSSLTSTSGVVRFLRYSDFGKHLGFSVERDGTPEIARFAESGKPAGLSI